MSVCFWTIFCLVYGIFLILKMKKSKYVLLQNGMLAGFAVSFFCLYFLPAVFSSGVFYATAAAVLAGVACGTALEKRYTKWGSCICFVLAGVVWGYSKGMVCCGNMMALLAALLGGSCLYLSCAVILPSDNKEGIWLGLGGICGFWFGVWLEFLK